MDRLPEPAAGLRRVEPVGVDGRALEMIDLSTREVRTANVPAVARAVRGQDERPLACANQYPNSAQSLAPSCVCRVARRRHRATRHLVERAALKSTHRPRDSYDFLAPSPIPCPKHPSRQKSLPPPFVCPRSTGRTPTLALEHMFVQ